MSTVLLSPKQWPHELTVLADKWGQSSSMAKAELPVVGITAPILVVLAAYLGNAQGLPPMLSQGLAMILGLALVSPFMLRRMLSYTLIEIDGTRSTAPMHRVMDVPGYYVEADYEGLSGQMVSLSSDELEFLTELVDSYFEKADDMSQREWGFAKGVQDKLEEALNV